MHVGTLPNCWVVTRETVSYNEQYELEGTVHIPAVPASS